MKCKYRAIIFDFDGVLVNSADIKTRAYAELYKEYGPDVVEQVIKYDSLYGGISRFEKFRYYHQKILEKDLSQEEEIKLCNKFSQLVEKAVIVAPWVPGVPAFLSTYANVIDFYIVSGTPEEELLRIISTRKIPHYFKGIYGAPQTKASMIFKILSLSGLQSEDVVMIGDSITDYEATVKSGIAFIGRITNDQEIFFPTSIVKINDFNDKAALCNALFV